MATISKETQNRLNYTEKFIENGGTVTELLKDEAFRDLVEKERQKFR